MQGVELAGDVPAKGLQQCLVVEETGAKGDERVDRPWGCDGSIVPAPLSVLSPEPRRFKS